MKRFADHLLSLIVLAIVLIASATGYDLGFQFFMASLAFLFLWPLFSWWRDKYELSYPPESRRQYVLTVFILRAVGLLVTALLSVLAGWAYVEFAEAGGRWLLLIVGILYAAFWIISLIREFRRDGSISAQDQRK